MAASALSRSALVGSGLLLVVLLAGCRNQRPSGVEREVSIYGGAIRWLIDGERGDDGKSIDATVYVEAVAEDISLEVQSGVVEALTDVATIRFIDDIGEAVDRGKPGDPVRGGGVLLGLGTIRLTTAEQVHLYVERYRDIGDVVAYELALERTDERWRVVGVPDPVTPRSRR